MGAMIFLIVVAAGLSILLGERKAHLRDARNQLVATAEFMASVTARRVERLERLLRETAKRAAASAPQDRAGPAMTDVLEMAAALQPELGGLRLLDAHGQVLNASTRRSGHGRACGPAGFEVPTAAEMPVDAVVSLDLRPCDGGTAALVLSLPFGGSGAGAPDGFVVAFLAREFFATLFNNVRALSGADMQLLTQGFAVLTWIGRPPDRAAWPVRSGVFQDLLTRDVRGGSAWFPSESDRRPALAVVVPVAPYGLVVTASLAEADALADWRVYIQEQGGLAAFTALVIGLLTAGLARQVQRRDLANRERLAESERARRIFGSMLDGALVIDERSRIQGFNPAAEKIFGYRAAEVLGRSVDVLMPGPVPGNHRSFVRTYLETGTSDVVGALRELTGRRKDGSHIPLELSVSELQRDDRPGLDRRSGSEPGRTGGGATATVLFVGLVRDISARKEAERALMAAKALAEVANRAKSDFLTLVTHELRTPLNAIIGFSDMIVQQVFGPSGDRRYTEFAKDIGESGRHLLQMIDRILSMARIESGQCTLDPRPLAPAQLIDRVIGAVADRAAQKGIQLTSEMPAGLPPVLADEAALEQALDAVLANAVQYTSAGGRVIVRADPFHVGFLVIVVTDSGAGIDPARIEAALQPFGQIDPILTRRQGGIGLGLPLARSVLELHGGHLKIESQPGQGTTVCLFVPLAAASDQHLGAA